MAYFSAEEKRFYCDSVIIFGVVLRPIRVLPGKAKIIGTVLQTILN